MAREPQDINITNLPKNMEHLKTYLRDSENYLLDAFSDELFSKIDHLSTKKKHWDNFKKDIGIVHIYYRFVII